MAKKKIGQQLDLFGAMFSTEETSVENLNETNQEPIQALNEPSIILEDKSIVQEPITIETPINNVIFADDKIGVKIKLKAPAQPIITVENTEAEPKPINVETKIETLSIVQEEPIIIIEAIKENKTKQTNKPQTPNSKPNSKRGRKSFKEMDDEIGLVNIPEDEILNKKLYYPIREVAAFFNVNTSLIRAWETEFDILKPRKNRKGDRLFRVEDIKNLQIIYYLLRNKKYSVDGAKKYLKENKTKADTNQQLQQSLTRFRSFLLELKANLQA